MSWNHTAPSFVIGLLALAFQARAEVTVQYRNSSLTITRTETYDVDKDITLELDETDFAINVFTQSPASQSIGAISVIPADEDPVWLVVSP